MHEKIQLLWQLNKINFDLKLCSFLHINKINKISTKQNKENEIRRKTQQKYSGLNTITTTSEVNVPPRPMNAFSLNLIFDRQFRVR